MRRPSISMGAVLTAALAGCTHSWREAESLSLDGATRAAVWTSAYFPFLRPEERHATTVVVEREGQSEEKTTPDRFLAHCLSPEGGRLALWVRAEVTDSAATKPTHRGKRSVLAMFATSPLRELARTELTNPRLSPWRARRDVLALSAEGQRLALHRHQHPSVHVWDVRPDGTLGPARRLRMPDTFNRYLRQLPADVDVALSVRAPNSWRRGPYNDYHIELVAFSADASHLTAAGVVRIDSRDGPALRETYVHVWRVTAEQPLCTVLRTGLVRPDALAVTDDGRRCLCAGVTALDVRQVLVVDTATGRVRPIGRLDAPAAQIVLPQDGKSVVVRDSKGQTTTLSAPAPD